MHNKKTKRLKSNDYAVLEVKTVKKNSRPRRAVTAKEITSQIPIVNNIPQYNLDNLETTSKIDFLNKDMLNTSKSSEPFQLINSSVSRDKLQDQSLKLSSNNIVVSEMLNEPIQKQEAIFNEAPVGRFKQFVSSLQEPFELARGHLSTNRLNDYSKQLKEIYSSNFSNHLKQNLNSKDNEQQVNRSLSNEIIQNSSVSRPYTSYNLFESNIEVQEHIVQQRNRMLTFHSSPFEFDPSVQEIFLNQANTLQQTNQTISSQSNLLESERGPQEIFKKESNLNAQPKNQMLTFHSSPFEFDPSVQELFKRAPFFNQVSLKRKQEEDDLDLNELTVDKLIKKKTY